MKRLFFASFLALTAVSQTSTKVDLTQLSVPAAGTFVLTVVNGVPSFSTLSSNLTIVNGVLTASGGGSMTTGTSTLRTFSATASQSYSLTNTPIVGTLQVFRNGIFMTPGLDYSVSGLTVTFTSGQTIVAGDILNFVYYH